MKPTAELMTIAGYTVPVLNAPHFMASDLAGELSEGHPFAATYYIDSTGKYIYSLRSREGGIDVSDIAKSFGGGGHAAAAGFESQTPVHKKV
jgi:nanoRNase/pAp phosphatase (c-di-AMP/oligoRNAs hydrolase)